MQTKSVEINVLRREDDHLFVVEKVSLVGKKLNGSYPIVTFANSSEVFSCLQEPFPKAILLSALLEESLGIDLCKLIKESLATAHIPVILFVPDHNEKWELLALEAGADDVLGEDVSTEILKIRVDRLINNVGHTYARTHFLQRVDRCILGSIEDNNLNVEALALCMNMDRKTLYKKIKHDSGHPPQTYIRNLRLSRAAHLLKRGTLTISETAFMVGFSDVSYFSKCFKEYFGKLPSQFVKANGNAP